LGLGSPQIKHLGLAAAKYLNQPQYFGYWIDSARRTLASCCENV